MYCPFCGQELPDEVTYCYHCGRKIQNINSEQSENIGPLPLHNYGYEPIQSPKRENTPKQEFEYNRAPITEYHINKRKSRKIFVGILIAVIICVGIVGFALFIISPTNNPLDAIFTHEENIVGKGESQTTAYDEATSQSGSIYYTYESDETGKYIIKKQATAVPVK